MGLTKNIVTSSGIEVQNAYFRINSFNGSGNQMNFGLAVYIDRDSFLGGKPSIDYLVYSVGLNTQDDALNFTRQAYAYLKTTDDFVDAEDVLEEGQQPLNV